MAYVWLGIGLLAGAMSALLSKEKLTPSAVVGLALAFAGLMVTKLF